MAFCLGNPNQNDRQFLELPGVQTQLIKEVAAKAKKTIVVLINGGPIAMEGWLDDVDGLFEGALSAPRVSWLPASTLSLPCLCLVSACFCLHAIACQCVQLFFSTELTHAMP